MWDWLDGWIGSLNDDVLSAPAGANKNKNKLLFSLKNGLTKAAE